jgi:beta-fructofuranosidase
MHDTPHGFASHPSRRGVLKGGAALALGSFAAGRPGERSAAAQDEDVLAQRRRLARDPHRPIYHFLPPANWMNDPNGVIEWNGTYHLFYQHNPDRAVWGNIHWGHASSEDLLHWRDLPIALAPTPGGPDERGCFSGCAVDDDGVPTVIYTGARGNNYDIQTQCVATSDDDLLTWVKYGGNPVLSQVPVEAGQTRDFRDPFVWREGDAWYMLLASRIVDVGGTVFRYRSTDLRRWEYLGPLLTGDLNRDGNVWECANFFPLGDKWVLIVSSQGPDRPFAVFSFVGSFRDGTFTPETEALFDSSYLYAPLTMADSGGRRLLWGWLREGRTINSQLAAGWSGVQAIPRELSLRDGRLTMEPVRELQTLRGESVEVAGIRLGGDEVTVAATGRALDIVATLAPEGPVGLALACAPDGSEQTRIAYLPESQELVVDRSHSSLLGDVEPFPHRVHHELAPGEMLDLRILLDGSVLEIIANGRTSVNTRIYPSRADSTGMRVFGDGRLETMTAWTMRSIWPE